jgi:UDP-N-acetylglucosamine 4,6-dehydratase
MVIGKRIMIIGGTGALGRTLTKRYHNDNDILVFSRDEHKHVRMKRDYPDVSYQIGDVKDKDSLLKALNEYKPHVVVNTAALKHVPVCEHNPFESVKVNILGHENLLECLQVSNHQIETLMFVSTDKACKPINVYGMCKAISERLYIDFANKQKEIKVVLCRYGNVLESTGSVIPFFKSQLQDENITALPVTDPRMTRFLISLDESVELIDWALHHPDSHGAIVVPKLESLNIVDLAKTLSLAYLQKELPIDYVGIRPGEKIHEEMVSLEESLRTKEFEKYFMITDEILNDETWSYSSLTHVMLPTQVNTFLREKGAIL